MESTLIISSQGQVVIPAKVRRFLGVKAGSRLKLFVNKTVTIPSATIVPQPESWMRCVKGLGRGIWGKGEEYIENERRSWSK
ncbi:hypothetical protein A3D00_00185 [Candidatus Woesebacteria bacterium RIFCSPHIGHO2_02_FULL_38_9]|nr:MAG: hypothetical protein A3D00_00185 [Candidatus Woesebacteria bacterium RIFCSPHIGHO2_02_FULL_38_9]OGM57438.1 MAG: hypothetical protein A3A50_05910 [Candidatus Woesebacteria bacterium RIFCSPLOWO2_01_FULL_38_20]